MTEQTPSNGRAEPTPAELSELCAASLQKWTIELAKRVGPTEAARLVLVNASASLEAVYGCQEAAARLRAQADRLAALAGPVGHA